MTRDTRPDSRALARSARLAALRLCHEKKASHIGGALSVADILSVLYADVLRHDPSNPGWEGRDRLFYSKGHACTVLYAILEELGYFGDLHKDFTEDGSRLTSHASHHVPGVELSTGSLGHALPVACGVAYAGKIRGRAFRCYCIMSDGELDEGSNWEAILFASQHRLGNLCIVVDFNKIQSLGAVSDIIGLEPLPDRLASFGWRVERIDGHDHDVLRRVLSSHGQGGRDSPFAVIADTVKGKGVSFMENSLRWHYRSPDAAEYAAAVAEISRGSAPDA